MAETQTTLNDARISPLEQRAIEVDIAEAFLSTMRERLGGPAATELFQQAVERLASSSAQRLRPNLSGSPTERLWSAWSLLGGEGRLDLELIELTDRRLTFHVNRCAYAELYQSRDQEEIGIAFSCRRDEPFAKALAPGIAMKQSRTILEGSPRCEFTYTMEDR